MRSDRERNCRKELENSAEFLKGDVHILLLQPTLLQTETSFVMDHRVAIPILDADLIQGEGNSSTNSLSLYKTSNEGFENIKWDSPHGFSTAKQLFV